MKFRLLIKRACVEAWIVVALFGTACGFVGARWWNGAQPPSLETVCDEIVGTINSEYAIVYGQNVALRIEDAMQKAAEKDTQAARTAKLALYRLERGAHR